MVGSVHTSRVDFRILNPQGESLECSIYQPVEEASSVCVIYLHGNCGSRLDASQLLGYVMPSHFSLVAFDFSGCGLSSGEFVTLGIKERGDIDAVLQHLSTYHSFTSYVLWGRSMGAATALMCAANNPAFHGRIAALVLDSPFASLKSVTSRLCKDRTIIPEFLIDHVISMVRDKIMESVGLDIFLSNPIDMAHAIPIPAFFTVGDEDSITPVEEVTKIYERYGGFKDLMLFYGNHSSPRPDEVFQRATHFIHANLMYFAPPTPAFQQQMVQALLPQNVALPSKPQAIAEQPRRYSSVERLPNHGMAAGNQLVFSPQPTTHWSPELMGSPPLLASPQLGHFRPSNPEFQPQQPQQQQQQVHVLWYPQHLPHIPEMPELFQQRRRSEDRRPFSSDGKKQLNKGTKINLSKLKHSPVIDAVTLNKKTGVDAKMSMLKPVKIVCKPSGSAEESPTSSAKKKKKKQSGKESPSKQRFSVTDARNVPSMKRSKARSPSPKKDQKVRLSAQGMPTTPVTSHDSPHQYKLTAGLKHANSGQLTVKKEIILPFNEIWIKNDSTSTQSMLPEQRAFSLDRPSTQGLSLTDVDHGDDRTINFTRSPTYKQSTKKIACGKQIKASVCLHIDRPSEKVHAGFVPMPSRFKELAKAKAKKTVPPITTPLPESEDTQSTTKASGANSVLSLPRTPPHVRDGNRRRFWYKLIICLPTIL